MRAERGLTFCLSSQVGCALRCPFCATGLMGLERNLQADEIVAQVMVMGAFHRWEDEGFNLVLMGMGEPLANYEAVLEAIRILHDPQGLNVGARRITVSTAGLVPQIERLAGEDLALGLALSLHATTDELRDTLVPVNRRWPLAQLLPAVQAYGLRTGRRVSLEYTLLAGVNDSPEDADRLAAIARDLPSKINLIPYNPVPGLPYRRPTPEAVQAFAERLYPRAPAVTVRHTQGGEIGAACGQLRRGRPRVSLRSRLVAALLLVALLPTAVFTVFTLVELDRATRRWYRPGVERALESARRVNDAALARLEATVRAQADALARAVPRRARSTPASGRALAAALRDARARLPAALPARRRALGALDAAAARRRRPRPRPGPRRRSWSPRWPATGLVRSPRGALAAAARLDSARALRRRRARARRPLRRRRARPRGTRRLQPAGRDGGRAAPAHRAAGRRAGAGAGAAGPAARAPAGAPHRPPARRAVGRARPRRRRRAVRPRGPARRPRAARPRPRVQRHDGPARGGARRDGRGRARGRLAGRGAQAGARVQEHPHAAAALAADARGRGRGDARARGASGRARTSPPRWPRWTSWRGWRTSSRSTRACPSPTSSGSTSRRWPARRRRARCAKVWASPARPGRPCRCWATPCCWRGPRTTWCSTRARPARRAATVEVDGAARGRAGRCSRCSTAARGVPAAVAGRVFEPYVSTKRRGSGLGLSLVRDIARQHGGSVTLEDRPGGGACARLALPLAAGGRIGAMSAQARLEVLVVDDDPAVRGALRRALEEAGHAVTEAADDGEAALARLAARPPTSCCSTSTCRASTGSTRWRASARQAPGHGGHHGHRRGHAGQRDERRAARRLRLHREAA